MDIFYQHKKGAVNMMSQETYAKIQNDLSHLLDVIKYKENNKYKHFNQNERDAYKQAVLACKSVVSNYKPNR